MSVTGILSGLYRTFLSLCGEGHLLIPMLIINAAGFLVIPLLRRRPAAQSVLTVVIAVVGGCIGLAAGILLFDRKPIKENVLSRVLLPCIMTLQCCALLFFGVITTQSVSWAFPAFITEHKALTVYLAAVNAAAFAVFGLDKRRSVRGGRRIRIVTLFGFAFAGGGIGSLAGMKVFRHKTQKSYFTVGIPAIIFTHAVILFTAVNLA